MAQMIVRKLHPELVAALRARAARRGHSMEEEHREILRQALGTGQGRRNLKDLLLAIPCVGKDADFERPRQRGRRVSL